MKIKLLKDTGIGSDAKQVGDVVEVDSNTGRYLIGTGHAEAYTPPKPKPKPKPKAKAEG